MKTLFISIAYFIFLSNQVENNHTTDENTDSIEIKVEPIAQEKIQVALLLDTSNSMDGLIDQAKSRLWNVVNTLTTLRYSGKAPTIEISLYEYGNSSLSQESGYIRQVTVLTTDLDLISEQLFGLRTNGGSEYCGHIIQTSTKELNWDNNKNSMKLIYIAGNEPFTQGNVNYVEAISDALSKGIFVNTIHCGDDYSGQQGMWKDGAEKGKGEYFFIDQNRKVIAIPTPYDVRIDECNTKLNATYIYYGHQGYSMKERQETQDSYAAVMSAENKVARAAAKANYNYSNANWDLVDGVAQENLNLKDIDKSTLPEKYRNLSDAQLKAEVEKMKAERKKIQKEILELNTEREKFIQKELNNRGNVETDLGTAINNSILKLAKEKGYVQIN